VSAGIAPKLETLLALRIIVPIGCLERFTAQVTELVDSFIRADGLALFRIGNQLKIQG
jgi:hypothetical protein